MTLSRRLSFSVVFGCALLTMCSMAHAQAKKPNILIIWGDVIGGFNVSAYNLGAMGYKTPNIDRIAREGALFTDWYGQQSCTAGRAAFITGQSPIRTGLTKVGLPGAPEGLQKEDVTLAELLKPLGYVTGQFGKNHLGDRNNFFPTVHGFDEFFGNFYHLNAEQEPEIPDYPKIRSSRRCSARAAYTTASRPIRTIPLWTRASAKLVSRSAKTPARST
jgi:arylsulfatase A-like enzyme